MSEIWETLLTDEELETESSVRKKTFVEKKVAWDEVEELEQKGWTIKKQYKNGSAVMVTKKDGSQEIFDKNKIYSGVVKSCYKRPVTKDQIDALVNDVEQEVKSHLEGSLTTTQIGEMVMNRLRNLDEVSYVRFASVYREFKDAETFMKELEMLREG
jgi:transcriptional regulator NrdR